MNEKILAKARSARRASSKAVVSAERKDDTLGTADVIPSASSFVRPSTDANGKINMNWQDLQQKLTPVKTPPRPTSKKSAWTPNSSSRLTATSSRSLSRPRSSPVVKSKTPIKNRSKTSTKSAGPVARRASSVTIRRERMGTGASSTNFSNPTTKVVDGASMRETRKATRGNLERSRQSFEPKAAMEPDIKEKCRGSSLQSRIGSGILAQPASSSSSPGDDSASSLSLAPKAPSSSESSKSRGDEFVSSDLHVTRRAREAAAKIAARRRSSSKSPTVLTSVDLAEPSTNPEVVAEALVTPNQGGLAFDFDKEMETKNEKQAPSSGSPPDAPPKATVTKKVPRKQAVRKGATTSEKTPPLSAAASARQRAKRRSVSGTSITPENRTPLQKLPLSVQRERESQFRLPSKGTEKSETSRRNLDKRTARLRYSGDFKADILAHLQQSPFSSGGKPIVSTALQETEHNGVTVFVRKRPIFQYELDRNDYDVVSMESSSADGRLDTVVVNNCTMHADMKRKFVRPMLFPCSAAFNEHCSDDDIYHQVAEPMVQRAARGGVSTMLMYGQTGSGKTHTMTGIEQRAAGGLFDALSACSEKPVVSVQFVELAGKGCKDLLGDGGDEVKLTEDSDGSVQLLNATSVRVKSADELARQIAKGKSRRATEATDVNGVSSRSHATCQVQISFPSRQQKRGLLTLIDCAGSERRHDSMYHSSIRQKESAEINASLWALKECIRARASSRAVVVPYRSHNLTRLLRESFERDGAKLSVIATVAPNATDTEHSMETLKTVSNIVGLEKAIVEGTPREVSSDIPKDAELIPPKNFDHRQLVAFLEKKKIQISVPDRFDGKAVMRMSLQQIRAHFFSDGRKKDHSEALFNALRKENDRVAKLQRRERMSISKARKEGQ